MGDPGSSAGRCTVRGRGCFGGGLRLFVLGFSLGLATGGCPQAGDNSPSVQARITLSASSGPAPLRVAVSALDSTSNGASVVKYLWDFAGQATSSAASASHTFEKPGRYLVRLTVTDDLGRSDVDIAEVRATGGAAIAVIAATPTGGAAPLVVRFDGTSSSAGEDEILDYFWSFGDGGTSRAPAPSHVYERSGEFKATLRVVSGGGAESTAELSITVDPKAGGGSLQFDGQQIATLPVDAGEALAAFTFEARCKGDGGTLVTFGSPVVSLDVSSLAGRTRLRFGDAEFEATASTNPSAWGAVRLSYDGAAARVYLDGIAVIEAPVSGSVAVDSLALGSGFDGRLATVRLWSRSLAPGETSDGDLVGDWSLNEGSGQTLRNGAGGEDGVRGLSEASEARDPAWSSDGP